MIVQKFLLERAVARTEDALINAKEALQRETCPAPGAPDEATSAKWKCEAVAHSVSRALGSLSFAQTNLRAAELLLMEEINRLDEFQYRTPAADPAITAENEKDPR